MRYKFVVLFVVVCGLLAFNPVPAFGENAPADVASALLIKLAAFEKNTSNGGDLTIYVLGSSEVAAKLKGAVGEKIGSATLKAVNSGNDLPADKPAVLFLGDAAKVADVTAYTQSNKVFSATNNPELAAKGISLGIGIGGDGKPEVVLNVTSSKAEGLDWNPAIMKIAKTVK